MEKEVLERIQQAKETKSSTLDLSNCTLDNLHDALGWEAEEKLKLTFLNLSNNHISDSKTLEALSGFDNLIELRVSNNNLKDLNSLPRLKSLEVMDMGDNLLTKCPQKDNFPLLRECHVNGNPIEVEDMLEFYFTFKPITVFISYNDQDNDPVTRIKNFLHSKNIEAIIDQSKLISNDVLEEYTKDGIDKSDYRVCIISEKSLLASWVAMEKSEFFKIRHSFSESKLIPFVIEGNIRDPSFVTDCNKTIKSRIEQIGTEIRKRIDELDQFHDIVGEYDRLCKFKYRVTDMVVKIRSFYADATTSEKWPSALEKLYNEIKASESTLRNLKKAPAA